MKLEINDDEAYLEISREFNEENLQKFEAMLRDILFNQKIKEVNKDLEIEKFFDASDILWLLWVVA